MRGATDCAKKLKSLISGLRTRVGKVQKPAVTDPITQLILGVLTRDVPEAKARDALEALKATVVDYNELRVIPPMELASIMGDLPEARLKGEDIARALNRIFAQEHAVSLDRCAQMNKRDGQAYLDKVDGLEPYTRARIRLLGFGQHAMPLDEATWTLLRAEGAVDPKAGLEEAQQFVERNVAPEDALEVYALLKKHAWSEYAGAVKKRGVERITSVPPDRTTRNMLQAIVNAGGGDDREPDLPLDDEEPLPEIVDAEEGAPRGKSGKGRRAAKDTQPRKAKRGAAAAKSARTEKSARPKRKVTSA